MKAFKQSPVHYVLALLCAFALAFSQGNAMAQQRSVYQFSQQEIDQMLAPVALYPDALLSQVLMASTYPLEVVEAARWSRTHSGFSGDDAVRAAGRENWDPSVKSLLAFPQILDRMDADLQWTQSLGDAFLDQESQVMDTVQNLRRRAQAAGNLRSDERLQVVDSGSSLSLRFYNPQVVYLPYYDPMVVYGSWWWASHPPVAWHPWAGYYARPGYARGFYWGSPVGISVGFFFGGFDWAQRQVRVVQVNNYYYNNVTVNRSVAVNHAPGAWHHNPDHRRGIAYRSPEIQQRFAAANPRPARLEIAEHGQRAAPADGRRLDSREQARPEPRSERRTDVRTDARPEHRAEARNTAKVRAVVPAAQAAQPEARADSRRAERRAETRSPEAVPTPREGRAEAGQIDTKQMRDGRENARPAQRQDARAETGSRHEVAAGTEPRRDRGNGANTNTVNNGDARREAESKAAARRNGGEHAQVSRQSQLAL